MNAFLGVVLMAKEVSGVFVMLTGIALILFVTSAIGWRIYQGVKTEFSRG